MTFWQGWWIRCAVTWLMRWRRWAELEQARERIAELEARLRQTPQSSDS